jgi:predicted nucleic acid-binding Zn ribbon protein
MRRAFHSIAEGLEEFLSSPRVAAGLEYGRVCNAWTEAAGPAMAGAVFPVRFEDGRLRVAAKNSVWANEAQMRVETVKNRMNEILGRAAVSEISVTVARYEGLKGR